MNLFVIHLLSVVINVAEVADDPYARICVPEKVKNMNGKVFNLMLWVNETRFLVQHESRACKSRLKERVCNSKQKWSNY